MTPRNVIMSLTHARAQIFWAGEDSLNKIYLVRSMEKEVNPKSAHK